MLATGQIVDRYTVEGVIGAGGTAVVYRVRHAQLQTPHALKVLSLASSAIRRRMLREGQVQATMRHPNVVAVTDVLDIDGAPGLLMEHVEGPSLEQALARFSLDVDQALTLFHGVVAGVRHAHMHGLVHRDLKPANVLLARTEQGFVPKVTDFGLAKVIQGDGPALGQTRQGVAMGTPAYMAPEQIRDARTVDQRADLFSLGCLLYELVCGVRTFPGNEAIAIYNAIMGGDYIPPRRHRPDLPDRVDQAIRGMLMTDRDRRIPDCDTLLAVLAGERTWDMLPEEGDDLELEQPEPTEQVPRDKPPLMVALRVPAGGTPLEAPTRSADPSITFPEPGDEPMPEGSLVDASSSSGSYAEARPTAWWVWALGGMWMAAMLALAVGGWAALSWLEGGDAPEASTAPAAAAPPPVAATPPPTPEEDVDPGVEAGPEGPFPDPAPRPALPDSATKPPPPAPAPAAVGVVRLLSDPKLAEIIVDGVSRGRTPLKLDLSPGTHKVKVVSGTLDGEFPVVVRAGDDRKLCWAFATGKVYEDACPR